MAASTTTTNFQVASRSNTALSSDIASGRRRRIDRSAGRALEVLGHAIEYLTDEFILEGGTLNSNDAKLEAVQMLMALNRQIYFECPEVPTFGERVLSLLGMRAA
jgi:hypothetical protein